MTSFKLNVTVLMLLVILPVVTLGYINDHLAPDHAPLYDHICEEVECGKGTCEANTSHPMNYVCHCDYGWMQNKDGIHDDDLSFLPCTIPNCTLDYSCQPAPPPVQEKDFPHNGSFHDCTLGDDCANLGIKEDDSSPTTGGATNFVLGKLQWMSVLVMVMAMLVYK
ncbi:hypothetical protein ACFE04_027242 [Oxalis oulophora]